MRLDEEAALRSTSWGLGQTMGFNAGMVGYESAGAMTPTSSAAKTCS
jgi:hypothetical protein